MTPELVIFDCDGVLVDSEAISIAVLCEVVAEAGGDVSEAVAFQRLLGRSMPTVLGVLSDDYGVTMGPERLDTWRERLFARFRAELRPVEGLVETLDLCPWPRCVASSSQPERLRLSLEISGLLPLFDPHIFSASEVPRGKPHPDLFHYAAHRMGARPEATVVIEDSPTGIAAAQAAGMRVIAFTGATHAAPAGLAAAAQALAPDAIVARMQDLPEAVAALPN